MIEAPCTGKLLVYASDLVSRKRQLKFVSDAAKKMATSLKLTLKLSFLEKNSCTYMSTTKMAMTNLFLFIAATMAALALMKFTRH